MNKYNYSAERIAVVAMGCLMPDAFNTKMLWENILQKKVSIKEIPDNVFNKSVFYSPDMYGKPNKNDKTYTKIAAIPDNLDFTNLSRKYKIPPAIAAYMDTNQKATVFCVDQVMEQLKSSLPKERTAVILSNGSPGEKFENVVRRTFFKNVENQIRNHPTINSGIFPQIDRVLKEVSDAMLKDTQPITEDTATGYLQNITSGRISNIFDLWGPSYVIDGACASSLITICDGVSGLLNHEYDAVITGGLELTISEVGLAAFSAINALSPDGEYPFDARANGFVMGLGGGIVVLKRLSDALNDGDFIYSVISGYGLKSDGKGKYIAAPIEEGQVRAIQSACRMAGYPVDTIEMIEAHGTGTIVGDVVEVAALKNAFSGLGAQKTNYCGIGSIKSNIGHLRNAAGIAGFIKATLALNNKILPATANIKEINPKLQLEGSPFYVLGENKKWAENSLHPRRANISSYGFGGADCHVCLEEFRPEFLQKSYSFNVNNKIDNVNSLAEEKEDAVFFSGDSAEELLMAYKSFIEDNCDVSFEKAVYMNNLSVCCNKEWRVSICASSMNRLKDKFQLLEKYIKEDKLNEISLLNPKGIYFGKGERVNSSQVAFMFPGQASQYPNMLKELYETYPSVRSFYMNTDALWKAKYNSSIMPLIFGEDEGQLKEVLKDTRNTHPAMFISNMAIYRLLYESGVKADYMIGHSLGEIVSLYAAEMIDIKSAVNLIGERGLSFDRIDGKDRGKMISVKAKADNVEEIIKESGFKVCIANINSPEQTVVGGSSDELDGFVEFLNKNGYKSTQLNVSHAFHTDVVAKAAKSFSDNIKDLKFNEPKCKVMACHMADFYNNVKSQSSKMPGLLKKQILSPVKFEDSLLKLYDEGVRVFIEAGPSNVLSSLAKTVLSDKDVKIVSVNNRNKNSVEGYKQAMAALFSYGVAVSAVPSNSILGLQKEGIKTVEYKVDAQTSNIYASGNLNQNIEVITTGNQGSTGLNRVEVQDNKLMNTALKNEESLVYSGVSIGLPGTFKKVFSEDNFNIIFEGKNLIELLTKEEAQSIFDLNITRLLKTEKETVFKKISSLNEVIHFMSKFGKLDMINDYLADEKLLEQMTQTVCAGVAAGYEALRDAGIPLVREYKKMASGSLLPGRLVLPEAMQEDTGIIFANGLFPLESVITEVSKFTAYKFGSGTRTDILNFFETIISKVSDEATKKLLGDWFALYYSRLSANPGESEIYEFNHNFMTLLASQANTRLAQLIGASGPNLYINAACSSVASSVTVAEDMLRSGRARRMIVIGADIPSNKNLLPWFGAGFSSIGALTESDSLFDAAVPFDNRRSGMILGSGATGLVIEKELDVQKRGMNGICRILGTHIFNAAGHQTKIDTNRHCIELDRFMSRMEREYNLNRNDMSSKLVYCSHETYSHKPGCSYMEKTSLESAFKEKFRQIKVINTKGMTGHILGASIDEAVCAKALQYQKVPPVVNYKELDPELEGLNLSKGGAYDFEFVLRAVSAFGGQGNYHLMQRIANGDERIVDKKAYREWINMISSQNAELKNYGRILVVEDTEASHCCKTETENGETVAVAENSFDKTISSIHCNTLSGGDPEHIGMETAPSKDPQAIIDEVLAVYSNVTQYPKDMLELSMELEADLGIDTVKQATAFSMLADRFSLEFPEGQGLSNYTTIGQIVELILNNNSLPNLPADQTKSGEIKNSAPLSNCEDRKNISLTNNYEEEILKLISEITLYPVEFLEKDMEMEADLGIDTVKQATIFSILIDRYGFIEEGTENISQYRTIGALIDLFNQKSKQGNNCSGNNRGESQAIKRITKENPVTGNNSSVRDDVLEVISEITQYPVEMLEEDMELEADLGVDTIKQATILSELAVKFNIDGEKNLNPSEFKTIKSIINVLEEKFVIGEDAWKNTYGQNGMITENSYDLPCMDLNNSIGDEENGFLRELCVQYPIAVEEKSGNKDFELNGKSVIVIGDNHETVKNTSEYLKKISGSVREFIFDYSLELEELENRISYFAELNKDTDVILDTSHLGKSVDFESLPVEKDKGMRSLNSLARFIFYKSINQNIPDPEVRIVCAVSMDGCFGYAHKENMRIDPFYGALCGFYKGLRKELSKSKVKIVDLGGPEQSELDDRSLKRLKDELEEEFKCYEVGYTGNKRITLKLENLDRSELAQVENLEASHFVITGGGNGITAEIVLGISKMIRGRFTILGRTNIPSDIEELSNLDEGSLEQKKLEIHEKLKKKGKKATPAEVQTEYSKLKKAISVYRLLNEVRKNGCDANYISCDVADYAALKNSYNDAVQAYGPANVIIHAAGMEKSRLLNNKTKEEFQEIFAVKANGLCNLYSLADKKALKVLIGFTSISGRFGNEAQLDYCSANNFISSFMSMVKSQHEGIRALSISWSGWKDMGMAWRNEFVKENSEEMGLHLIEPERGTNEFLNILKSNLNRVEIVISRGLGKLAGSEKWHDIKNKVPLIDWVSKKDGEIEKVYKVLSVKTDPIINHHRLGATPLMPIVGFMEIGAEAHSLIFGKKDKYCFKNVEISNPLKLFNDKPQEIVMKLEKISSGDCIEAVFCNHFKPKVGKGRMVELNRMSISGTIGEYEHINECKNIEDSDMKEDSLFESLTKMGKKHNNAIRLGTLFIDKKSAKINKFRYNQKGAILTVALSEEQITNKKYDLDNLLINPAFTDTLMQSCGVHASVDTDRVYLPWKIGEFGIVKVPREAGLFRSYAKLIESNDDEKVYDVILVNEDDEVNYYAKNVIVKRINQ